MLRSNQPMGRLFSIGIIYAFVFSLLLVSKASGFARASPEERTTSIARFGRFVNRTSLWERRERNILWGFRNLYNFHILHEPKSSYPFKAWFFGWAYEDGNPEFPGCDAIFHARGKTIDSWEVYSGKRGWDKTMNSALWVPVITARNSYFNEWHNGDPSVVKVGNRYFIAYSSTGHNKDRKPYGHPEDKDGSFLCIMGAVSEDGIHWQPSKEPILANRHDFGAPTVPQGDSHLYGSYHRPSILYEEGKFKLWFDYWTERGISMGYAENRGNFLNPKDWKVIRTGKNPSLPEWPNPDIVRLGDLYFCYADPCGYSDHPWKGRKICEAVSLDGINWLILGYIEPDKDAPAIHVPEALVIRQGGKDWIYLFYACQVGGEPYDYRYNRIRYMRRCVTKEEIALYKRLLSQQHSKNQLPEVVMGHARSARRDAVVSRKAQVAVRVSWAAAGRQPAQFSLPYMLAFYLKPRPAPHLLAPAKDDEPLGKVLAPVNGSEVQRKEPPKMIVAAKNPDPKKLPTLGVWEDEKLSPGRKLTMVSATFPNVLDFTCDCWCYESPVDFISARALDRGRLELRHRLRDQPNVILVTTVTPEPGAVEFLARAELEKPGVGTLPVNLLTPNLCWQLRRAPAFASAPDPYPEFIKRCFIFTEKGRTFLDKTTRRKIPCRPADDPCNNPPWVQMYVGIWQPVPQAPPNSWADYSPDRYITTVIGAVSRDGKYLAALANDSATLMAQAWHDCMHNNPLWLPADAPPEKRRWRLKIYAMENNPDKLLRRVAQDFPAAKHCKP